MAHEDLHWQQDSLCLEMGNELFFSKKEADLNAAKLICSMCPVQRECLNYAIRTRSKGLWGGLTAEERFDLRIAAQWIDRLKGWAYGYIPGEEVPPVTED